VTKAVISCSINLIAIFAWELANEPRCNGCKTSIITDWATKSSSFIKGLDANHMITISDKGFMNSGGNGSYPYTAGEGMDFEANLRIPVLSSYPILFWLN
jgi:mannan endo-1,4-beta-mannosidase